MKNKRVLIIIVVIILVLLLAIGIAFSVRNNTALFKHSYQDYEWESRSCGYIIYSNGIIKEYNDFDNKKELKKNKLTKNELEKLKELANKVKYDIQIEVQHIEEYNDFDRYQICDSGITVNKIYNNKLNKWIILDKSGYINGSNNSDESKEIKELVDRLYQKYIK